MERFEALEIFQERGDNGRMNIDQLYRIGVLTGKSMIGECSNFILGLLPYSNWVNDFKASTSFAEIMENNNSSRIAANSKPSIADIDAASEHQWYSDAIFA